jgi:hypothetical protein
VQQQFGVVEVKNVEGESSTFTVRLRLLTDGAA